MKRASLNKDKSNQVLPAIESGKKEFYKKAQQYWSKIYPKVNTMLFGLGYIINESDLRGSEIFLCDLQIKNTNEKHALDCGAGIGRVTKRLLLPIFAKVDMVEQNPEFVKKAVDYCVTGKDKTLRYQDRLGEIYNVGLQDFIPDADKYDLVWCQLVLGYLFYDDLILFFKRIRKSLKSEGILVIKENHAKSGEAEENEINFSIVRPVNMYEAILKQCGFHIITFREERSFPKDVLPLYMMACTPDSEHP